MHSLANIIRLALLALLLITPWLFGGVWARVQWVVMLTAAMLLAADLVTRFGDDDRPNLVPSAWLPVLAGIILGLFQLVPWPPALANVVAPGSVQLRAELITSAPAANPTAEGESSVSSPASSPASSLASSLGPIRRTVYAVATREHLALLTLAMAIFVLASIHLVDRQTISWFIASVAICGAALSFFGLIQRLSWNGKFYWVFEPLVGGFQSFGPFVNRNNAGGFLNICLAAGLGLLISVHWDPTESSSGSHSSRGSRRGRRDERRRSSGSRRHRSERRSGDGSETGRRPGRSEAPAEDASPPRDAASTPAMDAAMDADTTEPRSPAAELTQTPKEAAFKETGAVSESSDTPSQEDSPDIDPKSLQRSSADSDDPRAHVTQDRRRRERRGSSRHDRRRGDSTPAAGFPTSYDMSNRRDAKVSLQGFRDRASAYVENLTAKRLGSLALVAFIAGGVLCTASRGSILALFAAATATTAALAMRRGSRGHAAGLLAILVAGVALMSWAGQTEFVRSRFALTFEESQYDRGRLPNWLDAIRAVPQFPIAGSGLGTYPFVYERYQQRFLPNVVHRHAENQFLQAVVDGGLIALFLLLSAIALMAMSIVRLYRAGGPVNTSLAVAGTYGLVSQVVGGFFDFGLYIPANTMLMAAISGIVVGRAALLSVWPADALDSLDRPPTRRKYASSSSEPLPPVAHAPLLDDRQTVLGSTQSRRAVPSRRSTLDTARSVALGITAPSAIVTLLIGFLMIGCLFGSLEMNRAARIEAAVRNADLNRLLDANLPDDMARAAGPLITALPQRWDDAQAHQHLALLFVSRYQSEMYHRLIAEQAAMDEPEAADSSETPLAGDASDASDTSDADENELRDPELWTRASLQHLHRTLRQLERSGDEANVVRLQQSESVQELLLPAIRHFLAARRYAPTISRVHYRLAELSPVAPDLEAEQVHLHRAQLLSPGDATLWYWSGVLALNSDRIGEACQDWHRSLLLSRMHLDEIMAASQGSLTIRQLLEDTLPEEADLLLQVARKHFDGDQRAKYRAVFLARAEASIDKTSLPRAESEYTRAAILNLQGRQAEAVPLFAEAISRQSNNLQWRYEFARLLMDLEKFDEAHQQVAYLIRARPKSRSYIRLQKEFEGKRWRAGSPKK